VKVTDEMVQEFLKKCPKKELNELYKEFIDRFEKDYNKNPSDFPNINLYSIDRYNAYSASWYGFL
jgi:hypothetical protein